MPENEKREAGGEEREGGNTFITPLHNNTHQSRAHKGAGPPAYTGGSVSVIVGALLICGIAGIWAAHAAPASRLFS